MGWSREGGWSRSFESKQMDAGTRERAIALHMLKASGRAGKIYGPPAGHLLETQSQRSALAGAMAFYSRAMQRGVSRQRWRFPKAHLHDTARRAGTSMRDENRVVRIWRSGAAVRPQRYRAIAGNDPQPSRVALRYARETDFPNEWGGRQPWSAAEVASLFSGSAEFVQASTLDGGGVFFGPFPVQRFFVAAVDGCEFVDVFLQFGLGDTLKVDHLIARAVHGSEQLIKL